MPFRLRNVLTTEIVEVWGSPPAKITIPNHGEVHAISAGWIGGDYVFESFEEVVAPFVPGADNVNQERDRRIEAGFVYGGHGYQ